MNHFGVDEFTLGPQGRATKKEILLEREYVGCSFLIGFLTWDCRKWHKLVLHLLRNKDKDGRIDYFDLIRLAAEAGLCHSDLVKAAKKEAYQMQETGLPVEHHEEIVVEEAPNAGIKKSWFSQIAKGTAARSLNKPKNPSAFSEEDITRIKAFWLSPLISRVSPNKTFVVKRRSRKNEVTIVESVYYRQYTVGEAYQQFKIAHTGIKCSRTSFFKYKPANVKKPKSKQDVCPICKESRKYLPALLRKHHADLTASDRHALEGFLEHRRLQSC